VSDLIGGVPLDSARRVIVEPFVPALPQQSLRMWRRSFELLYALPSIASAGTMLIAELERAYAALEARK
jgi:hypothetical protein